MKNGFYITSDGKKGIIDGSNTYISLADMNIIELAIPCDFKLIYCYNNKLTKLDLPDGIKRVYCSRNNLTELIIPDQVKYIDCKFNNLTELICPDDCVVDCDPGCVVIRRTMFNRSKRLKNILK